MMELSEILAERIRLWSQVKLTDLDLWWRMSVNQKIKIARLEGELERLRKLGRESDSHRKTEMSVRGDHEGQLSWAIHWAKPMLDALLAEEGDLHLRTREGMTPSERLLADANGE